MAKQETLDQVVRHIIREALQSVRFNVEEASPPGFNPAGKDRWFRTRPVIEDRWEFLDWFADQVAPGQYPPLDDLVERIEAATEELAALDKVLTTKRKQKGKQDRLNAALKQLKEDRAELEEERTSHERAVDAQVADMEAVKAAQERRATELDTLAKELDTRSKLLRDLAAMEAQRDALQTVNEYLVADNKEAGECIAQLIDIATGQGKELQETLRSTIAKLDLSVELPDVNITNNTTTNCED